MRSISTRPFLAIGAGSVPGSVPGLVKYHWMASEAAIRLDDRDILPERRDIRLRRLCGEDAEPSSYNFY